MVEQCNSIVEQCGTALQNSVAQCDGKVWNAMVEQCNSVVEQRGGTVEQCGRVWWNSVEQYGGTVKQCGRTV